MNKILAATLALMVSASFSAFAQDGAQGQPPAATPAPTKEMKKEKKHKGGKKAKTEKTEEKK